MNKGVGIWLLIMIVPFFLGMFIHFIMPLEFILNGHGRIQESYNFYKSQMEQNTVRGVSFLNSKTINNKLQLFANMRSSLARLFDFGISYLTIKTDQVSLNSAFQLANANQSQLSTINLQYSMWYAPNVTQVSQFTTIQDEIYTKYKEIQPFIISYLSNTSEIPKGFLSIQTYLSFSENKMYFRFPSTVIPQLSQLNYSFFSQQYNSTLLNYQKGHLQTNFNQYDILKTCTPFFGQSVPILGIICYQVSTKILMSEITNAISSPSLRQIKSQYLMLLPIYPSSSNQHSPSIIANFTIQNLSNIQYSFNENRVLPISANNTLATSLFLGQENYLLHVNSSPQTIYNQQAYTTFYITPITTDFTFLGKKSIALYLLIMNTQVELDISTDSYFYDITVALVVPSVMMIFVSLVITTIILKKTLNKLDKALINLNEYSMLILKGDLDLEISNYSGTEDLTQLFQQFQILNLLSKYSEPAYFKVPKAERIVKYLKCGELFDKIGYSKVKLYQNIADCYFELGQNQKSIKYIQNAIQQSEKVLFENGETIEEVYQKKLSNLSQGNIRYVERRSKARIIKEKSMRRMLLKYAKFLYQDFKPGQSQKLGNIVQKLKKLAFPRVLNNEYLASNVIEVRYKFRDRNFVDMEKKLDELDEIISGYEELHCEGNEDCKTPPDVMRSYFRFMKACWFNIKRKPLEAFKQFVEAMRGNFFHPVLHKLGMVELKKILQANKVNPNCLNQMYFIQQYNPRGKREYVFLVDISNPKMTSTEIKKWKNKCRKCADFIFDKLIYSEDRLAIYSYCFQLQICFNLTKKQNQLTIMRKQISRSFRCKEQIAYPQLPIHLRQATERVKNLKQEKIFIIFMKNGLHVDVNQIIKIKEGFDKKSKFIFLTDSPQKISFTGESFYVMGLESHLDLERVLSEKKQNPDDSQIYIF